MRREELVMDILGGLDEKFLAEAMPRLVRRDDGEQSAGAAATEHTAEHSEVSPRDVRIYMAVRALGIAAAVVLVVGAAVLMWRNWDKITAKDPDRPGEVTGIAETPVVTSDITAPDISVSDSTDIFGQITDSSMPLPFEHYNSEINSVFFDLWNYKFTALDHNLAELDSKYDDKPMPGYWLHRCDTPYKLDDDLNIYSWMTDLGIPADDVCSAIEKNNALYLERREHGIAIPDYVFFNDGEITVLRSGNKEMIAETFASGYSIVVGGNVFSPQWLYYHTVGDYEAVGITREMVSEKYDRYKDLGLSDEAWEAFRNKLAVYIYSGSFYENSRVIPFEYDGDMFSGNAYNILTKQYFGIWDNEDGSTVTLTGDTDPFSFDGYAFPCGISETDDAYIFTFINGGVGGAYVIFKDEPDVLFVGDWNGMGYGGLTSYPDVVLLSGNAVGYLRRDRPMTLLSFGEMSVLGEYILKSNHSGKFVEFYDETIASGYTEGFTDESGQQWVLNGSMPLTGSPRYCIDDSLSRVTVGIKYFRKEESDEYMANGMKPGTEPEGTYFALLFARDDNGDFSVTYAELEDGFTKMFDPEPSGWETFPIPVNIELNCEWSDRDREIQGLLTGSANAYEDLRELLLGGWGSWAREQSITRTFPEDPDMVYEYWLQSPEGYFFKDADDLLEWMKQHFSERCYNELCDRMFTANTAGGGFAPPRFIIEDGKIYRDSAVRPGIVQVDFATAKAVGESADGNTIYYACIGAEGYIRDHYSAYYGAVTYEDDALKYDSLPEIDTFSYNGEEYGDVADIWG